MSLTVETAGLPGGNACGVAVREAAGGPEVSFTADPRGGTEALWFRFRLRARDPAGPPRVRLVLEHAPTLLGCGWYADEDPAHLRPVVRRAGGDWERLGPGTGERRDDGRLAVSWTLERPGAAAEVAFCYPYGAGDLEEFVRASSGAWRLDAIGATQGGRPLLRAANGSGAPGSDRPGLYCLARVHAGETPGSFVLEGLLRRLAEAGARAPLTWAVPVADADGVEEGAYGKDRFPHDLGRAFGLPAMRHEALVIQHDALRWRERCRPALALDFHAPGGCEAAGIYAFVPAWERVPHHARARPWAAAIGAALGADLAADGFERVASYPKRWPDGPSFARYAEEQLGIAALTVETPYALARGTLLTRERYREAGARVADGILRVLAAASLLLAGTAGGAAADDVDFSTRREEGRIVLVGENRHPLLPYHTTITFPVLRNLRSSLPLPARVVLPPGRRTEALVLTRVDERAAYEMKVFYATGPGDPRAEPDRTAVYLFPWAHGRKVLLSQGYHGRTTHQGEYALDFELEEGEPVHAARDGVVTAVRDDSDRGGPGPGYAKDSNYVHVLHADGTWASYAHLQRGGARVRVGDRVRAGEAIGLNGHTGQASGPHLHFAVSRASWEKDGGETIPTAFASLDGAVVSPEEGRWYYAVHPDGTAFTPELAERVTEADLERAESPAAPTGKVEVRPRELDDKVFLYCANGTKEDQSVTVRFTTLKNLTPSKRVPCTRVVPAGREVHLLTLARAAPGRPTSYGVSFSWRPAGR